MKKIGIVTFWHANNFGALLQNRALQEVLKKNSYEVNTIKFLPENPLRKKRTIVEIIKKILSDPMSLKNYIIGKLKRKIESNLTINQNKKFLSFRNDYIESSKTFLTLEEIEKEMKCDYYICGSDQIWNPNFIPEQEAKDFYFLNFCENSKKIAYAPSIAVQEIEKKDKEYYRDQLIKFKDLSTREARGAEIIKEISGKTAKVVLDPTLLLKGMEWRKIAKKPLKNKYIFAYFLGMTKEVEKTLIAFSKKTNLEIILIKYDHEKIYFKYDENDAIEVNKFLGYIDNAEYIFTDSFHGSVFSTVFNKKFFVFNRSLKNTKDMSSRITTILEGVGLIDRFIREPNNITLKTDEIDYIEVEKKLDILRKDSIEYLINSIEKGN